MTQKKINMLKSNIRSKTRKNVSKTKKKNMRGGSKAAAKAAAKAAKAATPLPKNKFSSLQKKVRQNMPLPTLPTKFINTNVKQPIPEYTANKENYNKSQFNTIRLEKAKQRQLKFTPLNSNKRIEMIAKRIAEAKTASEEYEKQNPERVVLNKGNYNVSNRQLYLNVSHPTGPNNQYIEVKPNIENPYGRLIRQGTITKTPTPPQNVYNTLQRVLGQSK